MNNTLSANTLFHFTNNIDNIVGILTDGFCPRLCMEDQSFVLHGLSEINAEIAIPMVCFCDIPLSQIKNHVSNYGGYAIGLSKDWGKRNGLNPVMYAINKSVPVKILNDDLKNLYKKALELKPLEKNNDLNEAYDSIGTAARQLYDFSFYLKPYEGKRWDGKDFHGDTIRFYDEREWRFIPELRNMYKSGIYSGDSIVLSKKGFLDSAKRNEFNSILAKEAKLEFKPNDINYIIVKSEEDVLKIEDKIAGIMGDKYIHNEVRKLTTRILCISRVLEDF